MNPMSDAASVKGSNVRRSHKDVIVSIRLPKGLVDELRDIQDVNHFMDLSDEIRFIVRRYCLRFLNSGNSSMQAPIELIAQQKRKEKLIEELSKMIDTLKSDDDSSAMKEEEEKIAGSDNG